MIDIALFDGIHQFESDDSVARSLLALKLILDNQYPEMDDLFRTKRILCQAILDYENILKEFDKINKK